MKTRYYLKIPRQAREKIPTLYSMQWKMLVINMRPNKMKVKHQFPLNEFGGQCQFATSKILTRLIIELLNYRLFVLIVLIGYNRNLISNIQLCRFLENFILLPVQYRFPSWLSIVSREGTNNVAFCINFLKQTGPETLELYLEGGMFGSQ